MGRANRKSHTLADVREHWTDSHPDRDLWSPGRLAMARTQTQEEYEALYGRGAAVEARPRVQEEEPRSYTDADILERLPLESFGDQDLHEGETLVNPLANSREYRGVIRVRHDPLQGRNFEGVTQYGPSGRVGSHEKVVYQGSNLDEAARAVNKMIEKKLAKDYEVPPGTSGRVSGDLARVAAEDICVHA